MRVVFSILFVLLALALLVCAMIAWRSQKAVGRPVSLLLLALIPPVMGNMIIISSGKVSFSTIGYYVYFLGMDLVMLALLHFTFAYCLLAWPSQVLRVTVYLFLGVDALQYLFNPFFHQAFATNTIRVDGFAYIKLLPYVGQTFHRVVDYSIFLAVLIVFIHKAVHVPRIYLERYLVILLAMIVGGAWQTFYIFSGTPVDRSMIGFGVFGLLVFYFSLYYRPMRLLDRMLAGIASDMPEALFFFDAVGRCIWANRPGLALTQAEGEDLEKAAERLEEIFGAAIRVGDEWSTSQVLGSGEDARYYELEKHLVTDIRRGSAGSFLIIRDHTQEERLRQQERHDASHDMLTGLYRREYLYRQIRRTIDENPLEKYLVVFVDVKNFKIVNDIFSNAFGDYALCCIADWIRQDTPEGAVYGRLAGDTFGVCTPASGFDEARIEAELSRFIVKDSKFEHHVLIHLGVYEVTEPGLDVSVMFDRAHMAISGIKDDYQRHIAWYDDKMRERVLWDQHISAQLPEAIAARQIRPYLQPLVDVSGKVVGAEALVRWIHPEDGFLSPAVFIPVFEKNGMIAQVDRHMWRCACETLAGWKDDPVKKELFISVNISPKDFYFMDVADEIKRLAAEFAVAPERLRLEITETVMMTDIDKRLEILDDLRRAGFIVEMDDFGSGYSSLNMLKDMPVDVLKVDMVFLNKAKDDAKARMILHNVMNLSGDLGIVSLTEGVETKEQYEMLSGMGCKLFQGYYFAKPMSVEEFEAFCGK